MQEISSTSDGWEARRDKETIQELETVGNR